MNVYEAARLRAVRLCLSSKSSACWKFKNAPIEFRALSKHGGGEHWIFFDPDYDQDLRWLVYRTGVEVQETDLVDFGVVYITAQH